MPKLLAKRRFRRPLVAALFATVPLWACRKTTLPTEVPGQPSVRLYLLSTVAGAKTWTSWMASFNMSPGGVAGEQARGERE